MSLAMESMTTVEPDSVDSIEAERVIDVETVIDVEDDINKIRPSEDPFFELEANDFDENIEAKFVEPHPLSKIMT